MTRNLNHFIRFHRGCISNHVTEDHNNARMIKKQDVFRKNTLSIWEIIMLRSE